MQSRRRLAPGGVSVIQRNCMTQVAFGAKLASNASLIGLDFKRARAASSVLTLGARARNNCLALPNLIKTCQRAASARPGPRVGHPKGLSCCCHFANLLARKQEILKCDIKITVTKTSQTDTKPAQIRGPA